MRQLPAAVRFHAVRLSAVRSQPQQALIGSLPARAAACTVRLCMPCDGIVEHVFLPGRRPGYRLAMKQQHGTHMMALTVKSRDSAFSARAAAQDRPSLAARPSPGASPLPSRCAACAQAITTPSCPSRFILLPAHLMHACDAAPVRRPC